jgi:hypothetical protein
MLNFKILTDYNKCINQMTSLSLSLSFGFGFGFGFGDILGHHV